MLDEKLSVARIAELVKARPRSVQYWAEAAILQPEPGTVAGGRGRHRVFSGAEAKVAAVAAALGPFGMSSVLLRRVCEYIRPVVAPGTSKVFMIAQEEAARALANGERVYAVIGLDQSGGSESAEVNFWTEESFKEGKVDPRDLFAFKPGPFIGLLDLAKAIEGLD